MSPRNDAKGQGQAAEALIQPFGGPGLGPLGILACLEPDLAHLASLLGFSDKHLKPLAGARLYTGSKANAACCLAGPVLGAPHAAMVLEQLLARGARQVVFFGWCGSLCPDMPAGEILLPTAAFSDEGTSKHYPSPDPEAAEGVFYPSRSLTREVRAALETSGRGFHEGPVWTTDALFRETPEKVDHFSSRGALAVEMELSALFAVARFRKADVAGLLIVSDEVFGGKWRSGVADKAFHNARLQGAEAVRSVCRNTKPQKG